MTVVIFVLHRPDLCSVSGGYFLGNPRPVPDPLFQRSFCSVIAAIQVNWSSRIRISGATAQLLLDEIKNQWVRKYENQGLSHSSYLSYLVYHIVSPIFFRSQTQLNEFKTELSLLPTRSQGHRRSSQHDFQNVSAGNEISYGQPIVCDSDLCAVFGGWIQ